MRKLEEDERMLQILLSRGISEKAAQEILDCLDHMEEMEKDPFPPHVHTNEEINGKFHIESWIADTTLDKLKENYLSYKNGILKEFAMITYIDSFDKKCKADYSKQRECADKAYSMLSTVIGMHIAICNMVEFAENGMIREEIAEFALEMSEDIRMFAAKYELVENNLTT